MRSLAPNLPTGAQGRNDAPSPPLHSCHGSIPIDTADIRLFRIFVAVARAGGLTAAQPELNLSLSSVSEKIVALEQRFGVRLCNRGRSGFGLTPEGEVFLQEARRLLGNLNDFSNKVHGLKSQLSGPLAIGIVDNMISDPRSPVAKAVGSLLEVAPMVQINLEVCPPSDLLRELTVRKFDVVIGSFPRSPAGLEYLDLYDESHDLYCSSSHPLFHVEDESINVDDVRQYRIIGRTYWAARDLKIFDLTVPHATVSHMEAEAHLILSGAFLGYLPDHFARPFIDGGRLKRIRPEIFSYKARFQIAMGLDWRKKQIVRLFAETCLDLARGDASAGSSTSPSQSQTRFASFAQPSGDKGADTYSTTR